MKISIEKLVHLFIIFVGGFLSIQACLLFVFHLPPYIQFLYLFLIFGGLTCLCLPLNKLVKYLNIPFIVLCLLMLTVNLISILYNIDTISNYGTSIRYFVGKYSNFWDSANGRLFGWGLMRPFFYFLYASILIVFLRFKNSSKIMIKTLIIVAMISCIYSVYQIFAFYLGLPFGSVFSGQDNNDITLLGIIRRTEGIFYEPGPHASFLSPIFCILFFQLFEKDKSKLFFSKKFTISLIVLVTFVLFNTFSPIGYLTPILAIIIAGILNIKNIKITKKIIMRTILSLIIGFLILIGGYNLVKSVYSIDFDIIGYMTEKVGISIGNMNAIAPGAGLGVPEYMDLTGRSTRNYAAIKIFKEHPIIGVGPGGDIYYFSKFLPFTYAHNHLPDTQAILNNHLKVLCETGIIGFTVYLLIICYPFYLYIRKYKLLGNNKLYVDSLLIGYFLYVVMTLQSNTFFYYVHCWLIYTLLLVSLDKLTKDRKVYYNEQQVIS